MSKWPADAGGGRGLLIYGRFIDSRGADVRVQTSSEIGGPFAWIFVTGGSLHAPDAPRPSVNDGSIYLTRRQASQLRGALQRWLRATAPPSRVAPRPRPKGARR